jgi:hypothetical protein
MRGLFDRINHKAGPVESALRLDLRCAALIFAAGFALGIIRVFLAIPLVGESGAVLAELPIRPCWRFPWQFAVVALGQTKAPRKPERFPNFNRPILRQRFWSA